ncbi:hypothetical protein WA026_022792 [Henosepilachna vigintioctopunctata]|uniref:Uncharacterized protein n=1 Tax=Henosepilachna vigintioctopunctata TaxID=420089 RepID=A0AAW1VC09_9CUCU
MSDLMKSIKGCDTTSAAYNMGKLKFIKIMQKHPELASGTALFLSEKVDPSLLTLVGERFFVALYSGNKDDSLDTMRYKRFAKTVTKNTFMCLNCSGETCSNVMELSKLMEENEFEDELPTMTPILTPVIPQAFTFDTEINPEPQPGPSKKSRKE